MQKLIPVILYLLTTSAFVKAWLDKHVTETQNNDGSKNIKIEAKLRSKKMNVEKKKNK